MTTIETMRKKLKIVEIVRTICRCDIDQISVTSERNQELELTVRIPSTSEIKFRFCGMDLETGFVGTLQIDSYTNNKFKNYQDMVDVIDKALAVIAERIKPMHNKYEFIKSMNLAFKGD